MSKITLIWAQSGSGVIGSNGQIPWRIPQDLEYFKQKTTGGVVIMGRRTWESIPEKVRPLPGRVNVVMSTDKNYQAPGALVVDTVRRALDVATYNPNVFVIGGELIYNQFMWYADELLVTEVDYQAGGDTFAPEIRLKEWEAGWQTGWMNSTPDVPMGWNFRHLTYTRKAKP